MRSWPGGKRRRIGTSGIGRNPCDRRAHVRAGLLHGTGGAPMPVGSPEWFDWVCSPFPAALRMEDTDPAFTARRERRGGGGYWYGYHRSGGSLRKVYLGRGTDLTAERLHAAAEELARAAGPGHVSRRNAAAEVRRLLRTHRLVTLVGIGGIGKSSLAGEVVACVDPDPVSRWVVELASIADAGGGGGGRPRRAEVARARPASGE